MQIDDNYAVSNYVLCKLCLLMMNMAEDQRRIIQCMMIAIAYSEF